jgi:hypothetical protein
VLKHTKSELTKAISKLITKIGNLGLKNDMQSARQTKTQHSDQKTPLIEKNGLI